MNKAQQPLEFKHHWRLLVAATVGVGLGLPALPYNTIGIFAPVLSRTFGWSFTASIIPISTTAVAILLLGPMIGRLVDRYGSRALAMASMVGMGLSYMALALSTASLTQYYATWAIIAVFGVGATPISFTREINRAFVARRGLALGVTLAGTALFVFVMKPLAYLMTAAFDWRVAVATLGALPIIVGVPCLYWGLRPDESTRSTATAGRTPPPLDAGASWRILARRPRFWMMFLIFLPVAFTIAVFPNMENILRTGGLSSLRIVTLTSSLGLSTIVGRVGGGLLLDRLWAPLVGAVLLGGDAAGFLLLSQPHVAFPVAVTGVLLLGLAAGVEVDLMSYLTTRYLGIRSYGTAFGLLFGAFSVVASALGPYAFGRAFDLYGSYAFILRLCAALLGVATLLLLTLGRYPQHRSDRDGPVD